MPRIRFTTAEDAAIMEGYKRYESIWNTFALIKQDEDFEEVLKTRSNKDIRYRYENIKKRISNMITRRVERMEREKGESFQPNKKPKKLRAWKANKTERKLLITAIGRYHGHWGDIRKDLLDQAQVEGHRNVVSFDKVSERQLQNYWETIKNLPTEQKLGICACCYQHAFCNGGIHSQVDFPRVAVGENPREFLTTCKLCLRIRVVSIAMFFSPFSGSDLETQEMFLTKCYNNHWTIIEASKQIDMDHDVRFKVDGIASMITDLAKKRKLDKILMKQEQLFQEILQGRCVPMESGDHTVKTEADRPSLTIHKGTNEIRRKYLRAAREDVKVDILRNDVFRVLFDSVVFAPDNFMKGKIFWGFREDGTRPRLEECVQALHRLRDHILHVESKKTPALYYFIKLGHERIRLVKARIPSADLPGDFKEVEVILNGASLKGPILSPTPLVTTEDLESHLWDNDSEQEDSNRTNSSDDEELSDDDSDIVIVNLSGSDREVRATKDRKNNPSGGNPDKDLEKLDRLRRWRGGRHWRSSTDID